MIRVVVGIVWNAQHEILVAQREAQKYQGGTWEFPGGKIEEGETVFQALQREFREEIGIEVLEAKPFHQLQHAYPERVILLDVWQVTQFVGAAYGREGQRIRWVKQEELSTLEIPDANKPILDLLT